MSEGLTFFVAGEPRAKQSFRVAGRGRGFTPARVKAWQHVIAWAGQQAMRSAGMFEPLGGQLDVELQFHLSTNRRIDADNLSKAALDGLNGICWLDDRQIMVLTIRKFVLGKTLGSSQDAGVRVIVRDLVEAAHS